MAKRFIDTDMWSKKWIRQLDPKLKLFWVYLMSRCNHAGIYEVDLELASFQLQVNLEEQEILQTFNGNIKIIKQDKWFIPKFIEFQYGPLNEKVNAHRSVIAILKKYKLLNNQLLINSSSTVQDKDKDKDKVLDIDMFEKWWKLYDYKVGKQKAKEQWKKNVSEDIYNTIMQHTIEYAKTEKKYRKHPERYLRDHKWEDEIIIPEEKIDLKLFSRDTCGFAMAYCSKCGTSESYKDIDILSGDSRCCNAKLTPNKENKC